MEHNSQPGGRLVPTSPSCAALASQVALLGMGMLSRVEETEVRAHLETCAYCRAATAADAITTAALRRMYGTGASDTPAALGASQGGLNREDILGLLTEDEPVAEPSRMSPMQASPASAALHAPGGWRSSVAALAAVLVVALLAGLLAGRTPHGSTGGNSAKSTLPASQLQALAGETVLLATEGGIEALRASDGAVQWRYPKVAFLSQYRYPAYALTVAGEVVYAVATIPGADAGAAPVSSLVALRVSDGHLLWSQALAFADYGEAIVYESGVLYLSPVPRLTKSGYFDLAHLTLPPQVGDYTAYAVRASDGKVLWQTNTHALMNAIPYVAGGMVYLGTTESIEGVRASDGKVVWSQPMGVGGGVPQGQQQAYVNGMSFVAVGTRLYVVLEVVRVTSQSADGNSWSSKTSNELTGGFDAATGALAAPGLECSNGNQADDAPPIPFPLVSASGAIYQEGDGILQMTTSETSHCVPGWDARLGAAQVGFTYSGGVLYSTDWTQQQVSTQNAFGNYTHAVRASDGKELWRAVTDGGLLAQIPTEGGGLVYAGAGSVVRALDARNGAPVWRYVDPAANVIMAPPVFVQGK